MNQKLLLVILCHLLVALPGNFNVAYAQRAPSDEFSEASDAAAAKPISEWTGVKLDYWRECPGYLTFPPVTAPLCAENVRKLDLFAVNLALNIVEADKSLGISALCVVDSAFVTAQSRCGVRKTDLTLVVNFLNALGMAWGRYGAFDRNLALHQLNNAVMKARNPFDDTRNVFMELFIQTELNNSRLENARRAAELNTEIARELVEQGSRWSAVLIRALELQAHAYSKLGLEDELTAVRQEIDKLQSAQ